MTRSAASYESEIRYWRDVALRLNQRLQSMNNASTRERSHGRGLHKDPTATQAVNNVTRNRGRN